MPTNKPEVVLPEKLELRMEVERIIQRRWFDNKIDGYLLDMATEIVDTLTRPADGEYDRELVAEMLDDLLRAEAAAEERGTTEGRSYFNRDAIAEQARLLRAADNRDAAGVRTANLSAAPQQPGQEVGSSEAMQSLLDPVVRRAIMVAVEAAAHYGWSHASWDWESVKGGLDRFGVNDRRTQPQQPAEAVAFTTGHCKNHKQPGGCQLHNLQCGYPECDRKPVAKPIPPPAIDIGKLRELVTTWQNEGIRLNGGADKPYTSDENSVRALTLGGCADELAALIGDGGEKWNG